MPGWPEFFVHFAYKKGFFLVQAWLLIFIPYAEVRIFSGLAEFSGFDDFLEK